MSPKERFNAKIERMPSGCWLWRGALANGQPEFEVEGKRVKVRRWAWRKGPVPRRLSTKCREPLCVRPAHLVAVRSGPLPRPSEEPDEIVQYMIDHPMGHAECMRLFRLTELELLDILDVYYFNQRRTDVPDETAPVHEARKPAAVKDAVNEGLVQLFESTEELW